MAKELRQGASNFLTIYVIVMPLLLSLLVTLAFGDLFAQAPAPGAGRSGRLATRERAGRARGHPHHPLRVGGGAPRGCGAGQGGDRLRPPRRARRGAGGSGGEVNINMLRWGETLAKNLLIIGSATGEAMAEVGGVALPIDRGSRGARRRAGALLVGAAAAAAGHHDGDPGRHDGARRAAGRGKAAAHPVRADHHPRHARRGLHREGAAGHAAEHRDGADRPDDQPRLRRSTRAAAHRPRRERAGGLGLRRAARLAGGGYRVAARASIKALALVLFAPGLLQLFPNVPRGSAASSRPTT